MVKERHKPGLSMTLGLLRQVGVRGLTVSCLNPKCRHEAIFSVDDYADEIDVPSFAARLVCSKCGERIAVLPNWKELPIMPPKRFD